MKIIAEIHVVWKSEGYPKPLPPSPATPERLSSFAQMPPTSRPRGLLPAADGSHVSTQSSSAGSFDVTRGRRTMRDAHHGHSQVLVTAAAGRHHLMPVCAGRSGLAAGCCLCCCLPGVLALEHLVLTAPSVYCSFFLSLFLRQALVSSSGWP